MENRFKALGIIEAILKAIEDLGYDEPTVVQSQSIPSILAKKDLIVRSKTGSGKTAAFGVPIIQSLVNNNDGPEALILTPTRELAVQVDSDLKLLSKYVEINTTAVYGQHNINIEIQALKRGISIVTGTPGRVYDHIGQKTLKTSNIRYLVLDEADKMLDMGFIDQVVRIIKALPKNRVTLLFSATMPKEIQRICQAYMKNPDTIEIESDTKTVDTVEQFYYRVDMHEKRTQLEKLLAVEQPDSCLIFCNTRLAVDRVKEFLIRKGYPAQSLHGAISQSSRLKTIQKFKKGGFQLLVATDVAARGIHVDDLSLVINYDVPLDNDSYVHRIGRTGRAGNGGKAITFATSEDIMSLYDIEEHVGAMIPEEDFPLEEVIIARRAEYAGKWAGFKMPETFQERLQEHKPERGHTSSRPSAQKRLSSQSSTKVSKSPRREELKKPYKPTESSKSYKPETSKRVQEDVLKVKTVVPKTVVVQPVVSNKPVPKGKRAYTPEEVAATIQRVKAKKTEKKVAQKKSFLTKLKEKLFKG